MKNKDNNSFRSFKCFYRLNNIHTERCDLSFLVEYENVQFEIYNEFFSIKLNENLTDRKKEKMNLNIEFHRSKNKKYKSLVRHFSVSKQYKCSISSI